jgi:HSP20 family protein
MANDLLSTRFARLFDETLGAGQTGNKFTPAVDVTEWDDRFEVTLDLPGVDGSEVTVEYHEGQLRIAGQRDVVVDESGKRHHLERRTGAFRRVFTIPRDIDAESIEAVSHNGVLTVKLPKSEKAKPRQIEVSRN